MGGIVTGSILAMEKRKSQKKDASLPYLNYCLSQNKWVDSTLLILASGPA